MKNRLSTLAILIVAIVCLIIDFDLKLWTQTERVIEHDVHSYYAYLPSHFIFDDLKQEKSHYRYGDNLYYFWPEYTEDGKKVNKMSLGLSIMYAPFFFVAHEAAGFFNYEQNGFSEPYKFFLLLSAIFYLIIGLDLTRKNLSHFGFSDKMSAVTILLLGLGTNLLCYSSQSATMPHVYNFFLFSAFLLFTIRWHQNPSTWNTTFIGLLLAMITLVRPSNVIIIIFFALYGVSTLKGIRNKKYPFNFPIILILTMFLVWLPQLIYWKYATGSYIVYSYNEEGFFFNKPKIIDGLFSFQKGWLVYTPIMIFALAGIFFLKDELKKIRFGLITFMAVNIYIIFSWWCWWYGGTYGQRTLIESYALLSIPLAACVRKIMDLKLAIRLTFFSIIGFFIWLNIFQTYQFEFKSLHHEAMTKKLYFKQFGKLKKIEDFDQYLVYPNFEEAIKGNR